MGMEELLPPVLWLLFWVQLCRGKCQFPCPTGWSQRAPAGSSRFLRECGFFSGATEMRVRRCSSPLTRCLSLCLSGWERVFLFSRLLCLWQHVPGCIYRHAILGYALGAPCS